MEALWKMEEDWNVSTPKAIAIFACAAFLLIALCVCAGAWRRRRRESVHQEPCKEAEAEYRGRSMAVEVLLGSVRWSCSRGRRGEGTPPLLGKMDVGRQSHNSTAAVWQRPILMGGKCELPRFSGLILYDQRGTPLHQCQHQHQHQHQHQLVYQQEMMATNPVVRTTLKDLL